ncbi:MAG: tetratricopeptide repeat protein [Pseudomonadota bacterium]
MDVNGILDTRLADSLFAALSSRNQQAQLDQLATQALSSGIDRYMNGDYDGAVDEFRRSMGISPRSEYAVESAAYMARSYLKLEKPEKAIDAYKLAIELNPERDDTFISLGNLQFSMERYADAEESYRNAAEINPSATNLFSLGQVYLRTENFTKAEETFKRVIAMTPEDSGGYFGLGQAYGGMESYDLALKEFEKAVTIKPEFWDAHAEIGYTYADMGDMDKAQEVFDMLNLDAPEQADSLSRYMYKVDPPRIEFADAESTFNYFASFRSPLSALDAYLVNANASKEFTMIFQFGKNMDMDSVQNRFNWRIGRSTSNNPGEAYNFGLKIPDSEIKLTPFPDRVVYDPRTLQAKLTFTVTQNATEDGTIDPSHIAFKFMGTDKNGVRMDPAADEWIGYSGAM